MISLSEIVEPRLRADIEWRDVESLLNALDAEITQGKGSRVRVSLNGVKAVFHEPRPEKAVPTGAIRALRDFLRAAGISVDEERSNKG